MGVLLSTLAHTVSAQTTTTIADAIFPKGEVYESENFTGSVWVRFLVQGDSLNPNSVGNVTFAPGARTNWHLHPAGQILMVTAGEGFYQELGRKKRILVKGDVVKCPPNVKHWHGANLGGEFSHLAISSRALGPTVWFELVTEEVYLAEISN